MRQDGVPILSGRHPGAPVNKMGSHWKNIYLDYHAHHVTCTVHKWQKALLYPDILELIYNEFLNSIPRWNISFFGYVIMPEHFHIMIHSYRGENVQKAVRGMRRAISGQARQIIRLRSSDFATFCKINNVDANLFYKGTCSKSEFRFWKEKPRVFPMNFWDEVLRKLDYIHMNPVRRGLVDDPLKWEHSSIKAHLFGEVGRIPIGFQNFENEG